MTQTAQKFAVIDPHWGEPEPILSTVSDTAEGAIEKALMDPDHQNWSGAALHVTPPRPGKWSSLQAQGYTVREIEV